MDLTPQELIDLGLDAVDAAVPPTLRAKVLGAVAARPRPAWPADGAGLTSQAAFMRTAAELSAMLETLGPAEWVAPTGVQDSTVHELVRHLVGVERYVLGQLGYGTRLDAPGRADHYRVAGMAAADLVSASGPELAGTWWREAMRSVSATAQLGPDHPVVFHHLAGTVRGLLVIRTFELWTHDGDIRRATGRPPNGLDDERLALMSSELMGLLARGMALTGSARPGRTARVRLTGAGGGQFDVALAPDEAPGRPDVTISVEGLELCRLAANRMSIADLVVEAEGDTSLVEPLLVGASAFALD